MVEIVADPPEEGVGWAAQGPMEMKAAAGRVAQDLALDMLRDIAQLVAEPTAAGG